MRMLTHTRWTSTAGRAAPWAAVLVLLQAAAAPGQPGKIGPAEVPEDHPIHSAYSSLHKPGQALNRPDPVARAALPQFQMRLVLPKRRYAIGEPVWATLTVRNASDRTSIRLSPPNVGQHVATAGVWRARWDWLRGGQFTGPLEVIPLNKGRGLGPPDAAAYGGVPVVLKPGETYTAIVPLNVAQQVDPLLWEHGGPQLAWFSGMGLTEPGLYRLYIQYANIEAVAPFGRDPHGPEAARAAPAADVADVPFEAVVPEPVEVEIVPPRMKAWDPQRQEADLQRYVEVLRRWEQAVLSAKDDMVGVPDVAAGRELLDLLDESEVAIRQSLQLTKLRFEFSALDPQDPAYRGKIANVLRDLQGIRPSIAAGPLADAYDLTLAHLLQATGRHAEARAVVVRLTTPDAAVLLHQGARSGMEEGSAAEDAGRIKGDVALFRNTGQIATSLLIRP